ncbi:MAG: C1 family peptidase, partial [Pseudomonadota bacterium]
MTPLFQTGFGMVSARVGRGRSGGDEKRFFINQFQRWSHFPIWAVMVLLASTAGVAQAAGVKPGARQTGLRMEARPAERISIDRVRAPQNPVATSTNLPAVVKNTLYLPKVRNQLLANCGAYAPSYYYKTYQEAREHGWIHPDVDVNPERVMSPGFTFPLTNGGENDGASISYVMYIICRYGIASWKDMPESYAYTDYPNEAQFRAAMPYRGLQVSAINISTTNGIQSLKAHLAGGDLAVAGVKIYHDVYDYYPYGTGTDNGVICQRGTVKWDGHAFTIIGYDDTRVYTDDAGVKTGAFLAVNSWGPEWGVVEPTVGTGGFCWFGYDYLRCRAGGEAFGDNAPAEICIMTDRTNYVPTDVAVLDLYHPSAAYLNVFLKPGSLADTNQTWLEVFPNGGSLLGFNGKIAADITDFVAARGWSYWLKFDELQEPQMVSGILRGFEVQLDNSNVVLAAAASSLPYTISNGTISVLSAGLFPAMPMGGYSNGLDNASAAWADFDRDGD